MECSIVNVNTKDKLQHYGILFRAKGKTVVINIHGTASNFYEEGFIPVEAEALAEINVSLLSTNNRGAAVLQAYPATGASTEKFEDCLLDIDAWIEFASRQGFRNIILQGHSLGTEKIVYYAAKGKYWNKVKSLILLAPSDSWGSQHRMVKNTQELVIDAKKMIKEGNGYMFLRKKWLAHAGFLPKTAKSFVNCFSENSELSKALPFRNKSLPLFRIIKKPVLAVIGDEYEFTYIPIRRALELLKKENPLTKTHQLHCNHDFVGKEKQLSAIIRKFVR